MKEEDLYKPYPHTGELGEALEQFKSMAVLGQFKGLPRYIEEFADQLFADILALEIELALHKYSKKKKKSRKKKK